MNTYTLEFIKGGSCVLPEVDGLTNVLVCVDYRLVGTDGTTFAYRSGECEFGSPDPENFTEFDDLTYELLCEWVEDIHATELDELKASIDAELIISTAQLDRQVLDLPWNQEASGPYRGTL